jgi:hypothetical protein
VVAEGEDDACLKSTQSVQCEKIQKVMCMQNSAYDDLSNG